MAQIGIIINPNSRRIKKMKTDPVEYYKKIGGDSVDIRLTRSSEDIVKAAKDFKKQGVPYLAISGGDGSIHLVLSKFASVYRKSRLPYVLILKDGSMNNIAKSYKLKGRGGELLEKLLKALKENRIDIVYRNTIKVNGMICFLFGLGLVTNFIYEFNKGDNKTPYKAVKVLLKTIRAALLNKEDEVLLKRANLKINIDGKTLWFKDIFAAFASTIANLAIGFNPTPRAYEKENMFHFIVTGMKPRELLLNINKIRKGVAIKHPFHYDNIASGFKITCSEKFLFQMDGDIYESEGKLTAEAGPRVGFVYV